MSKHRLQTWLALIVVAAGVLLTTLLGLFLYIDATAAPIHPDPQRVTSVTRAPPSRLWTDAVEQARQLVRAAIAAQNLPGISVAVGVGGEIVWAEGFGWADLENRMPVAPEMQFRIGGASIALSSAAVGLLLETDRLRLDAEIRTYVPAFPDQQWPVTLRQLMGHLAGVRNDAGDEEALSEHCESAADGLPRVAARPLLFEPGTRYRYSTYGWILVSAAVEAAAGEPFFTFMRTKIFEPLGMADTRPDAATEPGPDRATFYFPRFAADTRYGPESAREGDYSCFAGAGGFLSTPSDLVRFGMAVDSGRLLQPATVKMLQTSQRLSSGEETGYGLGWDLETASIAGETVQRVGHDGEFSIGGSTSLMTFSDRGLVVAVTSNISFADTSSVGLKVSAAFAEQARRQSRDR